MNIRNRAGRIIAGIIGMAGLAYPACAAICPKGHGACPYPGKCFLYTDTDTNSICDYTRTVSSGSNTEGPVQSGTLSTAAPATGGETSVTPSAAVTLDPLLSAVIRQNALFIGIALFAIISAALFTVFRSGRFGARLKKPGPALALSVFISLGVSEIVTYFLMGDASSGLASAFAAVYLISGSALAAYLWKSGAISWEVVIALAAESVLFGFVLTVLIMPSEFAAILGIALGTSTISFGFVAILAIFLLTFFSGRTFCAHICPVGSIQELAFCIKKEKTKIRNPRVFEAIRLAVFVTAIVAAIYAIDLLSFTGAYDFFSLTVSNWSVIFIILLIIAVVVYRPVCRAICPFGLLFAIAAHFSRYRLQRTEACINCKKCEKACPAGVAGKDDSKRECYLCARCSWTCPVKGALAYKKQD